jgi:hypothetical protein
MDVHLAPDQVEVARKQVRPGGHAGVVDQQGDVGRGPCWPPERDRIDNQIAQLTPARDRLDTVIEFAGTPASGCGYAEASRPIPAALNTRS